MPGRSKLLRNLVQIRPSSVILGSTAVLGTWCLANLDDGDYDNVATRDRIFGGYNNRIRQLSSREKIFHTFASHKGKDGQELMDWKDFRKAFLPYTFQAMEAQSREVQPDPFLKKFTATMIRSNETDMTGSDHTDELMNFAEFAFIEALAGIPKHRFYLALKMFDVDGSGFIEEDELEKVVELFKPTSMSSYSFRKVIQGSLAYQELVESDGKVAIEDMYNFLCKLRKCLLKLEFDQYDSGKKGSISSKDFAMSLVSYTHHKEVYNYVKYVKTCPDHGRITLEEFLEFDEAVLQMDKIVEGLAFYFKDDFNITPEVLQQAFWATSGKLLPLKKMKILLHVVAKNRDGTVNLQDLSKLMQKRQFRILSEWKGSTLFRKPSCIWNCLKWKETSSETIFNMYATQTTNNGEKLMHWNDFRNASLPPELKIDEVRTATIRPHEFMWNITRRGKRIGNSDEDWLINLPEFTLIQTLTSIPKHRFRLALNMFDKDRNGYIENHELVQAFSCFTPDSMTKRKFMSSILKSSMYNDLTEPNGMIPIAKMLRYLEDLRISVLRMEFEFWDNEQKGSISSKDFGRTLVSYAHPKNAESLLKRVETCPDYGRVTMEQYLRFNEAITQLDGIVEGLSFYFNAHSHTTAEVLQRAFLAGADVLIPLFMMKIMMHVFDKNDNGTLEVVEISDVMNRRQGLELTKRTSIDLSQQWRCIKEC